MAVASPDVWLPSREPGDLGILFPEPASPSAPNGDRIGLPKLLVFELVRPCPSTGQKNGQLWQKFGPVELMTRTDRFADRSLASGYYHVIDRSPALTI